MERIYRTDRTTQGPTTTQFEHVRDGLKLVGNIDATNTNTAPTWTNKPGALRPVDSQQVVTNSATQYINVSDEISPARRTYNPSTSAAGDTEAIAAKGRLVLVNGATPALTASLAVNPSELFSQRNMTYNENSIALPSDRGTLEISGANLMYEGARVKSWMLGRDVNPAGRGDGAYYAQGAFSIGSVRPSPTATPVGGWGNSVNNGCGGGCGNPPNFGLVDALLDSSIPWGPPDPPPHARDHYAPCPPDLAITHPDCCWIMVADYGPFYPRYRACPPFMHFECRIQPIGMGENTRNCWICGCYLNGPRPVLPLPPPAGPKPIPPRPIPPGGGGGGGTRPKPPDTSGPGPEPKPEPPPDDHNSQSVCDLILEALDKAMDEDCFGDREDYVECIFQSVVNYFCGNTSNSVAQCLCSALGHTLYDIVEEILTDWREEILYCKTRPSFAKAWCWRKLWLKMAGDIAYKFSQSIKQCAQGLVTGFFCEELIVKRLSRRRIFPK